MENEKIIVKVNREEDFLVNKYSNRGYGRTFPKLDICLFVSTPAKHLYTNLKHYAYGEKRYCFPNIDSLCIGMDCCDRKTLIKYLIELEKVGWITVIRRGANKPNYYMINDLSENKVIIHSELIYAQKPKQSRYNGLFLEAIKDYKNSELCQIVFSSDTPVSYCREIAKWFKDYMMKYSQNIKNEATPEEKEIMDNIQVAPDFLQRLVDIPFDGINRTQDQDKPTKKEKKRVKDYNRPIEEWVSETFCEYFAFLFTQKYKKTYMFEKDFVQKFKGFLNRTHEEKEQIKKRMEFFIERVDVFNIVSLNSFISGVTQNLLSIYEETGKLPSMNFKKQKTNENDTTKHSTDDFDDEIDEFLKQFDNPKDSLEGHDKEFNDYLEQLDKEG